MSPETVLADATPVDTATAATAPSPHPGMGATPHGGGCTFRTWAPNAARVWVAGSFNGWRALPLARDTDGGDGFSFFSAFVPTAAPGDEYKFLLENCGFGPGNPGGVHWHADPWARDCVGSHGNSVVAGTGFAWTDAGFRMPPWHELVIYQLHVGSFAWRDGAPGDFTTAMAKLDEVAALGVTAVQLLPLTEFPGGTSKGYNPGFPFCLEESYGRPEDLKAFVDAAHARGLAVLLDVVLNHFGPGLGTDGLWRYDGWSQDGYGGLFFYNDWRARTPWDEKTRPDFGRRQVRNWLRDSVLHWLHDYHIDGLRWDATAYIRDVDGNDDHGPTALADGWDFLREVNGAVKRDFPWKIAIAEDLKGNRAITRPGWTGGAGFDSQWDLTLHGAILGVVLPADDAWRDLARLRDALYHRLGEDALTRVVFSESHDEVGRAEGAPEKVRLPERIDPGHADSWPARKRSTLAAAIALTAPGIPMLFQGQEMLAWGWWGDNVPLDWSKQERFAGVVQHYRDLVRLRRNWFNNTRGLRGQHLNVFHQNDGAKVLAWHRWADGGPGDDVVLIANCSTQPRHAYRLGLPRGGRWYLRFNGDAPAYGADYGSVPVFDTEAEPTPWDGMGWSATIAVPPYSLLVFSQ